MKKINIIILVIAVLGISNLYSQSNSAYTRYGIGDVEYSTSARTIALGQLGIAVVDNNSISTLNPAAWHKLYSTRFGIDIAYSGLNIDDGNTSSFYSETEFKGFTFGFPVSQQLGIGVAAGLIPYSRISYKVRESYSGSEPYMVDYEGKGGLSEIFIGSSVLLPADFAFGATLDYYFGNFTYATSLTFEDPSRYPAEFQKIYKSTGFGTTLGLLSPDFSSVFGDTSSISNLRIGAAIKLIPEMDADTLFISRSFTLEDTIVNTKAKMNIPYRFSTGLSFILSSSYLFTFDYAFQPWSEFKFANKGQSILRDMHKISTGFEYKPGHIMGASVWEQMIWRAGLSFEKTQYLINNQGIDQYSVFGGFSFPLGIDNSIDIAVQYAMRGTTDFGLLKENIIKLNLGISFGELWFLRYDY